MNVAQILVNAAFHFPKKTAIVFQDRTVTYRELLDQVLRAGKGLSNIGIKPGDRVILFASNSINWIVAEFAIWSAGGIMVPINHQYSASEAKTIIEHSESSSVIMDSATDDTLNKIKADLPQVRNFISLDKPKLAGAIELEELISSNQPLWYPLHRAGEDGVVIYYTSGTTGSSKGCFHCHKGINWGASIIRRAYFQHGEILLVPMPLSFIYASFQEVVVCFHAGGTVILLESFSPKKAMENIQRHGVTFMMGVPTMYTMMLNFEDAGKYNLSTLRYIMSSGQTAPEKLIRGFREKFGIPIVETYGLSEAVAMVGHDMSVKTETEAGSCGTPFPGSEIKIFDENDHELSKGEIGEVVEKGFGVMKEYYRNPEATSKGFRSGWLHTGDMGMYDEDGSLRIVGRKKEMIIRGGANIFPGDVEEILYGNSKILEAAVVGAPDDIYGEQVRAVIVLKEGMTATSEEIKELCASKLAAYKCPKFVEFWDKLPKGPTGKVLKRKIQEIHLKDVE